MTSLKDIIDSQIAYYKERANEYDQWWDRTGRYVQGEQKDKEWFADIASSEAIVASYISKDDSVLELASGTGIWTKVLAEKVGVKKIKCVDGNTEPLEVLKSKFVTSGLRDKLDHIDFEVADLLGEWKPTGEYSVIFMGFFFSHVPPSKMTQFLSKLKPPAGQKQVRIVIIDSFYTSDARANPKDYSLKEGVKAIDYAENEPDEKFLIYRKLNNGDTHSIVKVFYEPQVLIDLFAKHGIKGDVTLSPNRNFLLANFTVNA